MCDECAILCDGCAQYSINSNSNVNVRHAADPSGGGELLAQSFDEVLAGVQVHMEQLYGAPLRMLPLSGQQHARRETPPLMISRAVKRSSSSSK